MFRPPFAPLDLDVAIYLDWVRVGGRPALKHQILNRIYTRSKTKWKEGGEWRASKFVFSDLNVGMQTLVKATQLHSTVLTHLQYKKKARY
jgi:hypothetical protein